MKNDSTTCPGDELLMDAALSAAAGTLPSGDVRRAMEHAAGCAVCGEALALYSGLRRANSRPDREGVRGACLDANGLAEFVDGVMPWEDRVTAEAHLATCGLCVRKVADLHTLVAAAQPARTAPQLALAWLRDGLKVVGAAVETFTAVPLVAVPVLDGAVSPKVLSWDLESAFGPIRITVQHDRGQKATLRLEFEGYSDTGARCRVHLKSGGALLESRTLDATGAVEFPELDAEDYEVEIHAAGEKMAFVFSLARGE